MFWSKAVAGLLLPALACAQAAIDDHNVKSVPLRTHSLSQPYLDSDLQSRWFDWGGDTVIRTDQYIRLVPDRQQQSGMLWSRLPLTATNWEVEFEFKIHGGGNLYGDGMAFWVTKERATQGPVFGNQDRFTGLGLFFDTYKNNRPGTVFPYVMAMLGDGETSYDHAHDGKGTELAGCSARGIRGAQIPTKARITYFQDNYLQLDLQYKTADQWITCFNVANVTLPQVGYMGFTAETGELSDNFDVIDVASRNLYYTNSARPERGGRKQNPGGRPRGQRPKKSAGWGWFFLKSIVFILVLVGGYVGWIAYRTQKRNSRF